jgi:hypothetical protein
MTILLEKLDDHVGLDDERKIVALVNTIDD